MAESEDEATKAAREATQDQQPSNLEKARESLSKKSGVFKRVFLTADGDEVIKALEEEFDTILFNPDTNRTNYNLGSRDLLVYIKQLLKYETGE